MHAQGITRASGDMNEPQGQAQLTVTSVEVGSSESWEAETSQIEQQSWTTNDSQAII